MSANTDNLYDAIEGFLYNGIGADTDGDLIEDVWQNYASDEIPECNVGVFVRFTNGEMLKITVGEP